MYNKYLEKLIQYLKGVQIYSKDGYLSKNYDDGMSKLIEIFTEVKYAGNHVYFIGNGGSAGIASHMTVDFMKNGGMKTYNFYDGSVITCMGNDYGYESVFSRPLKMLASENDLLVAISSSGNSQNIVNAIEVAKSKNMKVITFSGFQSDNSIGKMGDYNVYVPVCHYGMVESIHNLILQQVVDSILERDGECL